VSYDFHPYYTAGRWIYTDEYGWYWQSNYPWGDIPFHYGRWVNDPDSGWLWIPGYEWSPGWVTWRSNGQYIGWMPMPPDDAFLSGRGDIGIGAFGLSLRFDAGDTGGLYGYSRWYGPQYNEDLFARNWVFVGLGQIESPDYGAVAVTDPVQIVNIIHQTRNVTNYTVVNNYMVNRSVDVRVVERATGHPIVAVRAATVIRHPNLVATVASGQRVQMRMRAAAPHGTGIANSAPPPPPRIVAKLSTRVPPPKAGHAQAHLFTKTTVAAPEAQSRFHGASAPAAGPGAAPGGMTGPGAEEHPRPERPGMNGPNGGSPGAGQPGGMTGPAPERPRPEHPPGATGPNGGPSGGMAGPGAEHHPPPPPQGAPQNPPPKKPPPKKPPQEQNPPQ
jgi:hypothetical protein